MRKWVWRQRVAAWVVGWSIAVGWSVFASPPAKVSMWVLPVQYAKDTASKFAASDVLTTALEGYVESSSTHRLLAIPEGYLGLLKKTGGEVRQLEQLEQQAKEKAEQALAVRVSRLGNIYTLRGVVYRLHQGQWTLFKAPPRLKRRGNAEDLDRWLGELWSSLFPSPTPPPPPPPPTPKAGDRQTFEVKGQTFAMRYIPAGSFTMGSPQDEKQRDSNEGPQRQVTITKGFWMLETEVTQAQYKALVGSNPSHFSSCGDSCPVEQVSWDEARAFAEKLSAAQGLPACTATDRGLFQCKGWRLPTEAEWEYAARAGTTGRFHTGDCITPDQANFNGNYPPEGCSKGKYRGTPVAVGSFSPNAWGLYDMHGNVWEWVADWYSSSYDSSDLENPLQLLGSDPSKRSYRVIRGGSWNTFGRWLRSANRLYDGPAVRYNDVGFRLSRSL